MFDKSSTEKILELLDAIPSKRARLVIQHILEHGFVTTEDLEQIYGYNHPPRAARDVREAGIPLETFRVLSSDGRSIAAYRFGDLANIRKARLQGRLIFSKKLKERLYEISDGKCAICFGSFDARYLQIDHKVPYEVAGDERLSREEHHRYMLLCGSCNRAKSWSCEHCQNWLIEKSIQVCSTCYWAVPNDYSHIALREVRRIDILWNESEVEIYEKLKKQASKDKTPMPEYVKRVLAKHDKQE